MGGGVGHVVLGAFVGFVAAAWGAVGAPFTDEPRWQRIVWFTAWTSLGAMIGPIT